MPLPSHRSVSPELALVDPELARALSARAPDAGIDTIHREDMTVTEMQPTNLPQAANGDGGIAHPAPVAPAAPAAQVPAAAPVAGQALESILLELGVITAEQVGEVVRARIETSRPAEEILVERGFVAPADLERILGRSLDAAAPAAEAAVETVEQAFEPVASSVPASEAAVETVEQALEPAEPSVSALAPDVPREAGMQAVEAVAPNLSASPPEYSVEVGEQDPPPATPSEPALAPDVPVETTVQTLEPLAGNESAPAEAEAEVEAEAQSPEPLAPTQAALARDIPVEAPEGALEPVASSEPVAAPDVAAEAGEQTLVPGVTAEDSAVAGTVSLADPTPAPVPAPVDAAVVQPTADPGPAAPVADGHEMAVPTSTDLGETVAYQLVVHLTTGHEVAADVLATPAEADERATALVEEISSGSAWITLAGARIRSDGILSAEIRPRLRAALER